MRQTLSFVCKENATAISQIWEPSSAIWPWLERNVSNLSHHASCMMDGILLWQSEAHREASTGGYKCAFVCFRGGVRQARVAACIHAYQCLLCGYTARVPTVFVFLLQQSDMLIWKDNAGIIDTGARCGHVKIQTPYSVSARQRWLSLHEVIFHLSRVTPFLHMLDVIAVL